MNPKGLDCFWKLDFFYLSGTEFKLNEDFYPDENIHHNNGGCGVTVVCDDYSNDGGDDGDDDGDDGGDDEGDDVE